MKGLFLNEYYAAVGSMKLFMTLVLAAAAFLLFSGNATAAELFVYITVTALPINAVAAMRRNAVSGWDRYELTLPVRRKEIVRCRYIVYLFWVFSGALLALAVVGATAILHGLYGDLISMFALGIGIALLAGALFYLLAHILGSDRSETLLLGSVLGAVGIAVVSISLLHRLRLPSRVNLAVFVVFYLAFFLASYLVAVRIHQGKEYG